MKNAKIRIGLGILFVIVVGIAVIFSSSKLNKGTFGLRPTGSDFARGLVLYYDFESVSGTNVPDKSNGRNEGFLRGNARIVDGGLQGKAVSFDGSKEDQSVWVGANNGLNVQAQTLTAWVKFGPSNAGSRRYIYKRSGNGGANISIIANTGIVQFMLFQCGRVEGGRCLDDNKIVLSSKKGYGDNQWHSIIGIYTGTHAKLFVDGALQEEREKAINISYPVLNSAVGKPANENGSNWVGLIDGIRVYNRALDNEEVAELHKLREARPFNPPRNPCGHGGQIIANVDNAVINPSERKYSNISFCVNQDLARGYSLKIYDANSNVVQTLLSTNQATAAGYRSAIAWDGRKSDGTPAPAGEYTYKFLIDGLGISLGNLKVEAAGCTSDAQCTPNICRWRIPDQQRDLSPIPVPERDFARYEPKACRSKVYNGGPCEKSNQCASNICQRSKCAAPPPPPPPAPSRSNERRGGTKGPGDSCKYSYECRSAYYCSGTLWKTCERKR